MAGGSSVRRRFDAQTSAIGPYVPSLTADWLRDCPERLHRRLEGTLVFADVSGFTRLTGLLARAGRIGSEELADLINLTFERLLSAAYEYGAGLIKYGGDATLLWFAGDAHVARGCRAAHAMQQVMRRDGHLETSRGPLRLRMSVGVHAGPIDFLLLGSEHRELLVVGPGVSTLTAMEKRAEAGQIVLSDATATALAQTGLTVCLGAPGHGHRLRRAPEAGEVGAPLLSVDYTGVPLETSLSRVLRDHIQAGQVDHEHRRVTTGFLTFSGVDRILAERGPAALTETLQPLIDHAQRTAAANGVTFLPSDIYADGAKLLLVSGAPLERGANEDRMIATLRAIIEQPIPGLALRAGVNTGEVFVGDYGPPYRRTYSLLGDSVNLAARLMEHAGPGELLATPEVLKGATGSFAAIAQVPFPVKGKREPQLAFSVQTPALSAGGAAAGGAAAGEPMLGREAELARLLDAVPASATDRGAVVEVVGPPGIGKSRLLSELRARSGCDVLWTDGDVYGGSTPYAPFARLLRSRRELSDQLPATVLTERLSRIVGERAPHLLAWLPLIGIAAGLEIPSTPEVAATDPSARKLLLEQLTSEVLAAVLDRPTLLVFNDTHLMDDASIDLLGRLAADAGERPWLIVMSRRPEGRSALGEGVEGTGLELGPLDPSAVGALINAATEDSPLAPHRLEWLVDRAAGNPLFLKELLAHADADVAVDALPHSVEAAIAARIDGLPPPERRILRSASVLGMWVELPLLRELLDDDRLELGALSEFLEDGGDGVNWRFAQQLVREVAYQGLPFRRRSELHARTAAALARRSGTRHEPDAELLSFHCLHGARFSEAWRYSLIAARRARDHYAMVEAAESYRRALAAAAQLTELEPAQVADVRQCLGDVCYELGEFSEAERAYRAALRCGGQAPEAVATLQLKLGKLREVAGQHRAALRWLEAGQRTLAGREDREARALRARLITRRARIRYMRGQFRSALIDDTDAIFLARGADDGLTLAEALEHADRAATALGAGGDPTRTLQALAVYTELGDLAGEARVRNTLGILAYYRGEWSEAVEHYSAAAEAYAGSGRWWGAAIGRANVAEVLIDQGRLPEAERLLEEAMRAWRGVWAQPDMAFARTLMGRLAARSGRFAAALEHFHAARDTYRQVGESSEELLVEALIAESRHLAGDHLRALADADELLHRSARREGGESLGPLLQRVRGACLLAVGERAAGLAALDAAVAAAREARLPHEVAFSLRALLAADPDAGADAPEASDARDASGAWDGPDASDLQTELERLSASLGLQIPGAVAAR